MEYRVRQYLSSNSSEYEDAVSWTQVYTSGQQEFQMALNKQAIAAGGPTILELRASTFNGQAFASNARLWLHAVFQDTLHYRPETRVATICDEKDQYRYGFNTQEKVNEIAGLGNHYTALFWEYDSRLGRRWNLDPVDQVSISNYATNKNNPILNKDEKGNTPTAILGLAVGALEAGIDMGSQIVGNVGKGMSLGQAFKEIDYADVGLSFVEGFVDGTTLGASKFSGASSALFGAARASIDWKPGTGNKDEKFQMVGGQMLFGDGKYNKDLRKFGGDLAVEAIGIGLGKMFDGALGIGKQGKDLYRQRAVDQTIGRGILGNIFQVPTDIMIERSTRERTPTIEIEPLKFEKFEYGDIEE